MAPVPSAIQHEDFDDSMGDTPSAAAPASISAANRSPGRARRWAPRLLCAAALLLIGLILAEIVARFMFPVADDAVYIDQFYLRLINTAVVDRNGENFDATLGFRLRPSATRRETTAEYSCTYRTNSLGFRGPEISPKADDEYRLMLVGDSLFWGIGCEEDETIARQLERIAAEPAGATARVVATNFAVPGYNSVQELIVTQLYAPTVKPDHLVLGFFVGNDIIPNAVATIDEGGRYALSVEAEGQVKADLRRRLPVLWHSTIFRVASLPLYAPRVRYQFAAQPQILAQTCAWLDAFGDYCTQHRIRLTVVMLYPQDATDQGLAGRWTQSERVGKLLVAHCRETKTDVIDMLDFISGKESRSRYFYAADKHPNPRGNREIARIIFEQAVAKHIRQSH